MARSKVSRRDFIRFAGVASGAALLGACAPQVVTQIVKETEIVNQTQVVNQVQTQVVERLITPTPVPAAVTPQGKEMPADAAPLDSRSGTARLAVSPPSSTAHATSTALAV